MGLSRGIIARAAAINCREELYTGLHGMRAPRTNCLLLVLAGGRQANPPVQIRKPGVMVEGSEIGSVV